LCKVPVIILRLRENLKFLDRFSKSTRMADLMKIRLGRRRVVPCGRTDRDGYDGAYRRFSQTFAKAPKNAKSEFVTVHNWKAYGES
jgi:hypothetical protein